MNTTEQLSAAMRDVSDPKYHSTCEQIERNYNVCFGEITVLCGEDVNECTDAAMKKSLALVSGGEFHKALLINTVMNSRRILRRAREIDHDGIGEHPRMNDVVIYTSCRGEVSKELDVIEAMIERHGFDVLAINSWEFTSRHARYKDDLLFGLQRIADERQLTIVIFSHHAHIETKVGIFQRGTLGKLGIIASKIVLLEFDAQMIAIAMEERTQPEHSGRFVGEDGSFDLGDTREHIEPDAITEVIEDELQLVAAQEMWKVSSLKTKGLDRLRGRNTGVAK